MEDKPLKIGNKSFKSRLILGTGKYKSLEIMKEAIIASGTEIITVAIRRINLDDKSQGSFYDFIPDNVSILPNTAGCYTVEEAVRTARIARELLQTNFIKLEVIGDEKTLYPDHIGLLKATEILAKENFLVMPYTNDDPILAKKLLNAGACCVMPLAAPIGSGLGIQNFLNLKFILQEIKEVPVIVDAGVGAPSDAAIAMELGCDGVLMNSAVALSENPVLMAEAMKLAVECGRKGFLAGRIPKKMYAEPSSPVEGVIK